MNFEAYLRDCREQIEHALEQRLPPADGPAGTVARAMRHAVLGGGKRLRPTLAIASCEALGGSRDQAIAPAAALEMIHGYSLVHDDLPAMDDDDLRRGRPTVHRAFGEAEAILAGDALLTLALEILASEPPGDALAGRRANAVAVAARRAGVRGMVGGQMADLEAERTTPEAPTLEWIHRHKTGALMAASAEIGAIHAGAGPEAREAVARFGEAVGFAFQIVDDILDLTSSAAALGKTPGKDRAAGKATYPDLVGLEASRRESERVVADALGTLQGMGLGGGPLEALARYVLTRDH